MNETYTPTDAQAEALKAVTATVDEIKASSPSKAIWTQKIGDFAKTLTGKNTAEAKNENHGKRVLILSALLGVPVDSIAEGKATVSALADALTAFAFGDPIETAVSVIKTATSKDEPTGSELALKDVFSGAMQTSKRMKALDADDLQALQACSHAALFSVLKMLPDYDAKLAPTAPKKPKGVAEFLSVLIGFSAGSLDWFEVDDNTLAEVTKTPSTTMRRYRTQLRDYMKETGLGLVDIVQEANKPTRYKLNLLAATTAVMLKQISGKNVDPDALLIVAQVAGRLAGESEQKLRVEVTDAELAQAKELHSVLTDVVTSLPEPNITLSEQSKGSSQSQNKTACEKLSAKAGRYFEMASEAELEEETATAKALVEEINAKAKEVEANATATVDVEGITARLDTLFSAIKEKTQSELDALQEKAKQEQAESGETSTETAKEIATAYAATVETDSQRESEVKAGLEAIKSKVFLIGQLVADDPEQSQEVYERIRDIVDEAFAQGSYAVDFGE